jgi:ParB family chromosome partitioning protein
MNIVNIAIDKIDDADRLRPVDPNWVEVIKESIAAEGQLQPIEVAPASGGMYRLISGAHRVAAMRLLGRETIAGVFFEGSEDQERLREIDENLCRADLNDLDRAIFLGERKRIYERLHPTTKHGKGRRKLKVADSATILRFTLQTAQLLKRSERTIQKLVSRYENITPEVRDRLRGTWLANVGTELDEIAKLPPAEQVKVVDMLLREIDPQPSVLMALRMVRGVTVRPETTADQQLSKLMSAWRKNTNREARKQFRAFLASPESNKVEA